MKKKYRRELAEVKNKSGREILHDFKEDKSGKDMLQYFKDKFYALL